MKPGSIRLSAPQDSTPFPYSKWEYLARALWVAVELSVWRLAFHRFYFLRTGLLKLFGAKVPWRASLSGSSRIQRPWSVSLGEYCAVGPRTHIYNLGAFTLGNRSIISQDVYVCGGTHDYTSPTYPLLRRDVVIEDDVWICAGAFIGPGVRIGQGAVVGARAVVVKDVPPWTVVAGNPAREIKKRVLSPSDLRPHLEPERGGEPASLS
jgi:putative colanic acid biosynthesis acetyltransferase WcaF